MGPKPMICTPFWRSRSCIKAAWLCPLAPSSSRIPRPPNRPGAASGHAHGVRGAQTGLRTQGISPPGSAIEEGLPANSPLSGDGFTDGLRACVERLRAQSLVLRSDLEAGPDPALWAEFQSLLKLSPQNRLVQNLPDRTRQCFRWVNDLADTDSEGRTHTVHALLCEETVRGPDPNFFLDHRQAAVRQKRRGRRHARRTRPIQN